MVVTKMKAHHFTELQVWMLRSSKQVKWNLLDIYMGGCWSSQFRRTKCLGALGKLFLLMVLSHPTWKILFTYHLLQRAMCCTPDHTPHCLAGKKDGWRVSLYCRHGNVTEGAFRGRRRREEGRGSWLSCWVHRNLSWRVLPSWFLPSSLPALGKLGSWDAPSFCRLIFHLQWQFEFIKK